ncbi:MAG: TonB-dependent receptor [Paucibacter sp.]|nr:TonB-dependent receptor [Roseateles sp.]
MGGRSSKAVSGQLTAAEAIRQALEGSGLETVVMPDGTIVIRSVPAAPATPASAARKAEPSGGAADRAAGSDDEPSGRIAPGDNGNGTPGLGLDAHAAAIQPLTRVVVTGSRLKRIDAEGPVPVNVYTQRDLERSGQPTLERFLSSLNEVSVSTGEGGFGQTTGQGTVQLRGLPLGSTLVLINGRRIQAVGSSSGNYFNLSLIPMAAVERVEIVPVGSSAVYGGDALAGVVNVILKKSMEGIALNTHVASGKGTGDGSVSLSTGARSEASSFIVLGSYSKATPLTLADRGFFHSGDYRSFGGVDTRTRSCTPGTVVSTSGANLPGLSSTFAGIPAAAVGQALSVADFAATAGQPNLCNGVASGHGTALLYGTESASLHGAGERRVGDELSVFGELTVARDRIHSEQGGYQMNNVLVPANNLYNPFGVPVRVTERLGVQNGTEGLSRETEFKRLLIGTRGELSAGWDFEVTGSTIRDDGHRFVSNSVPNATALAAALGSASAATALNPFTTGLAANEDVLNGIWTRSPREGHGRRDQASAFVRGSPFDLPAGPVDVIAGAEASKDRYLTFTPGAFRIEADRTSGAVYGEARIPLLGRATDGGASKGGELAALTLAGRRDHYSDFGSANTFQAGAELRPVKTLMFRASTASSFKPPTLLETHVDSTSATTDLYGLVDPKAGNAPIVGGEVLRAANPNLQPEKGRAISFGGVWEPDSAGTRVALTAWRVKINGLISLLWPQVTLDNEALFPGLVTRAPAAGGVPGAVTRVLYTEVNFGSVSTAGADLEMTHSWKATGGKWTAGASATRTTQYDVAVTPAAPVEDRLGRRAADYWAPAWKGRVTLGFDSGVWGLGLTSRYLGAYRDVLPSSRGLGSTWMHDLAASLDLKQLGLGLTSAKEASLSLAVANLTDRQPEFVSTAPYYDVTQADWRGRYASVRLALSW